jgi:hypothetical protein
MRTLNCITIAVLFDVRQEPVVRESLDPVRVCDAAAGGSASASSSTGTACSRSPRDGRR